MNNSKLLLYINTIKHLRFVQIYYRLYYFVRNRFFQTTYKKPIETQPKPLHWKNHIYNRESSIGQSNFSFLNINHEFKIEIDWNFAKYGKLWAYNLNYFDFLNQKNIDVEEGTDLINNFINNDINIIEGLEPYPISLRGINWIKFLSINRVVDGKINQRLYNDYQHLSHNIEYHLLGNHLLENGFSLLFGAYYFQDEGLYAKANRVLTSELEEQILADGAHFELSPMYHQIVFHRLLDCVQLLQLNQWKNNELLPLFIEKATLMLSWLSTITYNNGNIPMVNDSTYDIAPSSKDLFDYANALGLKVNKAFLTESGYRKFENDNYELFLDVGKIGPKYQSGHAHADIFNFELYLKNKPIIVDIGISTYEKNKIRQKERGTASHNTICIDKQNQSQVWGGFRVAKRANITQLIERENCIEASHDGYRKLGLTHTRKVEFDQKTITIKDVISKETQNEQVAILHFHPSIGNIEIENDSIDIKERSIKINFSKANKIMLEKYQYSLGFNKTVVAYKIKVYFCTALETIIQL